MRRTAVTLLIVVACRSTPPHPADGPKVLLRVDGHDIATVVVNRTISLVTLLPIAPGCLALEAEASDGRFLDVPTPSTTYPGADIRLYVERGHVTLGVFRPPVKDVPPAVAALAAQPVVALPDVTHIDVQTLPQAIVPEVSLTIEMSGRPPHELDEEELETVTRASGRGWRIRDVVALAAPNGHIGGVVAVGESGEQRFEPAQLDRLTLKRNQRGQYVVQLWEPDAERPSAQVRGVTKLVVESL